MTQIERGWARAFLSNSEGDQKLMDVRMVPPRRLILVKR